MYVFLMVSFVHAGTVVVGLREVDKTTFKVGEEGLIRLKWPDK